MDEDGGLWYEREGDHWIREKHWWPQAEAMVGFLTAWTLSGDDRWWRASTDVWSFIKRYIRAPAGREWYWGIDENHMPMQGQDKAGFWKCPYHNSRACLQIIHLLASGHF
jgi:mannobiose 2-epimerase